MCQEVFFFKFIFFFKLKVIKKKKDIKLSGIPKNTSCDKEEMGHKIHAKEAWKHTNHKDPLKQVNDLLTFLVLFSLSFSIYSFKVIQ